MQRLYLNISLVKHPLAYCLSTHVMIQVPTIDITLISTFIGPTESIVTSPTRDVIYSTNFKKHISGEN